MSDGQKLEFPIVADADHSIAQEWGAPAVGGARSAPCARPGCRLDPGRTASESNRSQAPARAICRGPLVTLSPCSMHRPWPTPAGMLDPEEKDAGGKAFAARCVYVIGPDRTLKLSLLYPSSTGRNFHEARAAWGCSAATAVAAALLRYWLQKQPPFLSLALPAALCPRLPRSCCAWWTRCSWRPSIPWPPPPTGARARRCGPRQRPRLPGLPGPVL